MQVWRGALLLADLVLAQPQLVAGHIAIELGAGCGWVPDVHFCLSSFSGIWSVVHKVAPPSCLQRQQVFSISTGYFNLRWRRGVGFWTEAGTLPL